MCENSTYLTHTHSVINGLPWIDSFVWLALFSKNSYFPMPSLKLLSLTKMVYFSLPLLKIKLKKLSQQFSINCWWKTKLPKHVQPIYHLISVIYSFSSILHKTVNSWAFLFCIIHLENLLLQKLVAAAKIVAWNELIGYIKIQRCVYVDIFFT